MRSVRGINMEEKNDQALNLFKALGDKTRLAIVRILWQSDSYVELIASKLSLSAGTVSFHLRKLENAGLVTCHRSQFYVIYSLNRGQLEARIADFIDVPLTLSTDGDKKYREQVLSAFFEYGRLTRLPSQLKKREIVCEYLADAFELGRDYTETEVNGIISGYNDDYCTIRRELVSQGFFERNNGIYRRIR